jgi:hypothetical protein
MENTITYEEIIILLNKLLTRPPSGVSLQEKDLIRKIIDPSNDESVSIFGRLSHNEKIDLGLSLRGCLTPIMKNKLHMCKTRNEKLRWQKNFVIKMSTHRVSWLFYLLYEKDKYRPDELIM